MEPIDEYVTYVGVAWGAVLLVAQLLAVALMVVEEVKTYIG